MQRGTVREIAAGTRRAVRSGIDKQPVDVIELASAGVVGDEIESPEHHGGEGQAVYLYAQADRGQFADVLGAELGPGTFGENVTIDAWHDDVVIGDRLTSGDVVLELTGARVPCQKFAARMTELVGPDAGIGWVKAFTDARRPGWYARVVQPGTLRAGEAFTLDRADATTNVRGLELLDLVGGRLDDATEPDVRRRALASPIDGRIRAWLEAVDA